MITWCKFGKSFNEIFIPVNLFWAVIFSDKPYLSKASDVLWALKRRPFVAYHYHWQFIKFRKHAKFITGRHNFETAECEFAPHFRVISQNRCSSQLNWAQIIDLLEFSLIIRKNVKLSGMVCRKRCTIFCILWHSFVAFGWLCRAKMAKRIKNEFDIIIQTIRQNCKISF